MCKPWKLLSGTGRRSRKTPPVFPEISPCRSLMQTQLSKIQPILTEFETILLIHMLKIGEMLKIKWCCHSDLIFPKNDISQILKSKKFVQIDPMDQELLDF